MIYDVAIIGAGAVGTAIARELSRYNLNVILIEKEADVSMGATKANSGIVHGGFAESHSALKGRICYQGRKAFKQLDEELNFGFRANGSLVLSFDDDVSSLEKIMQNGRENGLTDIKIIKHDEILEMEPHVNPDVKFALYCEGSGVCSPYEMAIALAENAVNNGVDLHLKSEVVSLYKNADLFLINIIEHTYSGDINKSYQSRYLVNAAGLYSDKISAMLGEDYFTIRPRRGEYLIFARDTGSLANTVLFQMPSKMGKGILVTSTYHGNLMIGPDAVDDVPRDDTGTHLDRLKKIVEEASLTTKDFDVKKVIRTFAGTRAISSNNDFIIEETNVKGFINVAGIQSPGVTSSPAIAQMVKNILQESGLKFVVNPKFNPERKGIIKRKNLLPFDEVKNLIDIPSSPEKIICRCEQVTEAQIKDAMSRGIPVTTVDGVKRRTRAGMGWCQGAFCRPRVAEVMGSVLGSPVDVIDDVAHSGVDRVGRDELWKYLSN